MSEARGKHERSKREARKMRDRIAFGLVLLASICTECIPLAVALIGAAGILVSKPFRECPECGAHLDHGEQCDCAKSSGNETIKKGPPDIAVSERPRGETEKQPVHPSF